MGGALSSQDLWPSNLKKIIAYKEKTVALYHIHRNIPILPSLNVILYTKASASALTTLSPTTNQPVCCTCLLLIMLAVSQTKCLRPLKEW